jgi:AAA15 family ATPase/GTPase
MLIEFSVGNYRSFKEEVTFSMVAANYDTFSKVPGFRKPIMSANTTSNIMNTHSIESFILMCSIPVMFVLVFIFPKYRINELC